MKRLLLSVLSLTAFLSVNAQNCSELFFSEYVEGSNNNKALEIYNPTSNPVVINNNYRIVRYNNGTDAATAESSSQAYVVLGLHTIMPGDVWVITIDKNDPNGVGQEIPIDAALHAVSDTFVCPDYNISYALYHNGNDALSLQKLVGGNWSYVDIFGEIGHNPNPNGGSTGSWTDCPPFYDMDPASGCGFQHYWTEDNTLIRKSTVQHGVTSNPSPFDVTMEWDSLPRNTFSNLGVHNCNCTPTGIKEAFRYSEVKLYPNPSNGTVVNFVSADKRIASVVVTNALGQRVKEIKPETPALQISQDLNIAKGVYLTEIIFEDKTIASEKLIVE